MPKAPCLYSARESTDVLVVDLKLPGLNGLQLLAQTPTRPRATIAVTAFDDATTP